MAAPYETPLPPDLDLFGGYTIRLTAVSPTTGALVAGVTVSNLVIAVATSGDTVIGDLAVGPYLLVPGVEA